MLRPFEPADTYAAEAPLYDSLTAELTSEDLPFYLDIARRYGGPVLELACGTGRILIPVVAEVGGGVGVDLSPSMIEMAREKARTSGVADRVRFHIGDARSVELGQIFRVVTIPYSSLFQLATHDDLVAALRTARRHLAPDGIVVADAFVPNLSNMRKRQDRTAFLGELQHPTSSSRVLLWEHTVYAWEEQLVTRRRIYETLDRDGVVVERRYATLDIYFREPDVLIDAFRKAGLEPFDVYGGFARTPLLPTSDRVVISARAVVPDAGLPRPEG